MANMTMANKQTFMVFIRTRRNGRDVLLRERYNLVQYGTDDGKAPANGTSGVRGMTFIEGLPDQVLRRACASTTSDMREREVYDGIRIYDAPPFKTRIGSGMS